MRIFISLLCVLLFHFPLFAQWKQGTVLPDGTIRISPVEVPLELESRTNAGFEQISGFPKGFPANSTFKNFRNLTLADLDNDGAHEIITGINNNLYVYKNGTLLWQRSVEGVAIYPPSVADVDNDGALEIALITGGTGPAEAYLLEADGSDLPNWPIDFSDHWLLTAPTLADLDGDDLMEIIILERLTTGGIINILRLDGSPFSSDWPVALENPPVVTPTVGDVDNDGELEIVVNSSTSRYVFSLDGQFEPGFPIRTAPRQIYAFQSPIVTDMDNDQDLEIIGVTHSDANINLPEYYTMQHDGNDYPGWPVPVPDRSRTLGTPTVVWMDGELRIFVSRPNGSTPGMLYCYDKDGNLQPGFPIVKADGLEGIISVADVDGDDAYELVFGSNFVDTTNWSGLIHAYEMDGSGPLPGFPLKPRGWTLFNGVAFGDVDGNDTMDMVALSHTVFQPLDSTFINVYNLGIPYSAERVLWGTYKGSNSRQGLVESPMVLNSQALDVEALLLRLFPNPTRQISRLEIQLPAPALVRLDLLDAQGKLLQHIFQGQRPAGQWQQEVDLGHLPAGQYFGRLQIGEHSGLFPLSKM